jgi:GR25 family glycosyltransferase involved in LPS biosynthesis
MAPKANSGNARDRSRTPGKPGKVSKELQELKALVLGLERRPDRRERVEKMLTKEVPWLNIEFFPATDGKVHDIPETEIAQTWNTKNNASYCDDYEDLLGPDGSIIHKAAEFYNPGVEYKFSPGERGCAHSHYRMWKVVAESKKPMLILEDDVNLNFKRDDGSKATGKTFTERLELGLKEAEKQNAEVLYLGWAGYRDGRYMHFPKTAGRKNAYIRKAEYVWTTVAYILWPKGAKKLLKAASPMNQPVDNFMAWECRSKRLNSWVLLDKGDTNETWAGGPASQFDFMGDSDIVKSDGGDQGDNSLTFLAAKDAETTSAKVVDETAATNVAALGA